MEEHKKNIGVSRNMYRIHMVMYVLVIFFLFQVSSGGRELVSYLRTGLLTFYSIMFIVEGVSMARNASGKSGKPIWFFLYHSIHLIAATILFFLSVNYYSSVLGSILILLYAIESFYYIDFEDTFKRVAMYCVVVGFYLIAVCTWTFYKPKNELSEHFQIIIVSIALCCFIVFCGEMLTSLWKCHESKLLEQTRNLEKATQENKNLKENQEKLSKVNELLNMQKVQLQKANKRINNAHNEMAVQNEVARVISTSLDLELMVEQTCQLLKNNMELDYVGILLEPQEENAFVGEKRTTRTISYRTTKGDDFALKVWKNIQAGVYDKIFDIDATLVENQGRENRTIRYLGSLVSVPLKQDGKRIGNLIIGKEEKEAFTHSSEFYETIGGQVSVGITNALLYQQMENMAIRDGLTGIYNRRYLTEMLNAKISESNRKKIPVSLALFDIDKFKMINDTYGHPFGDKVIQYVARLLENTAKKNGGMAGRYGGEEFVIAFPGKGIKETFLLVERVHAEIKSTPLYYEGKEVQVKVSAGIASYPETCNNADDLLTRADWAMYHSKQNGRDQITIDNEMISSKM